MSDNKHNRKPYSEKTDLEKIDVNWTRTKGLFDKREWSGAILRSAIAAEIAANLVVREELQNKKNLPPEFVNNLLLWANGIKGKFDRLIVPICKGTNRHATFSHIRSLIEDINKERNHIAHSGATKKRATAIKATS